MTDPTTELSPFFRKYQDKIKAKMTRPQPHFAGRLNAKAPLSPIRATVLEVLNIMGGYVDLPTLKRVIAVSAIRHDTFKWLRDMGYIEVQRAPYANTVAGQSWCITPDGKARLIKDNANE
jgi:hypothetical protein